ncbi:hypothetical protein R8Z50_29800 [Longispora sp. K20-0274]|uniref:hypothetical protein n=1 Tax=Longispora sp. K20-0274 TaxID=3088255 RepID=UPI00399AA135
MVAFEMVRHLMDGYVFQAVWVFLGEFDIAIMSGLAYWGPDLAVWIGNGPCNTGKFAST